MRNATRGLSVVLVVLGAVMLVATAAAGAGASFAVGYVFGAGLLLAGALRLYLLSR